MMTVKEVSRLTGVSIRTLHHYDRIGLLKPAGMSEGGYRLYDECSLARLQRILIYRTLEFSLSEIRAILDSPDYDGKTALEQQIALLEMKREHLDNLILFAKGLKLRGMRNLSFSAFDTAKMDEYARRAKESWGRTQAWAEFEKKSSGRTKAQEQLLASDMMDIFRRFGEMLDREPGSPEAQALVQELQAFITAHFYECTKDILRSLGAMYAGGGEFTENIDKAGGEGTGIFVEKAIRIYTE